MPSARPGATESTTHGLATDAVPRALVRTITGRERLAASERVAAGHRVIDMSKRQLVIEPASASIIRRPPRLADDLFLLHTDAYLGATPLARLTGTAVNARMRKLEASGRADGLGAVRPDRALRLHDPALRARRRGQARPVGRKPHRPVHTADSVGGPAAGDAGVDGI